MSLNLSNLQIAQALGLKKDDAQSMTSQMRAGIVAAQATPELSGEVECDEVHIVAGHKGHPDVVEKGRKGRWRGKGLLEPLLSALVA